MSTRQNVTGYEESIVKIITNGGTNVGTGFIVTDDGVICTCYHVIGDPNSEQINDDIQVYFPYSKLTVSAAVLKNDKNQAYVNHINDIAFLQISVADKSKLEVDGKNQVISLCPLSDSVVFGHEFKAKGYREKMMNFQMVLDHKGKLGF